MANKIYTVVKDGETVKELKTLTAAKKLADELGGEVVCDGKTVYTAQPAAVEEETEELNEEATAEEPAVEKYRLLSKMNIRIAPSLKADKIGIAEKGTVVEVIGIENDWMELKDGMFILYGGGKYAERI